MNNEYNTSNLGRGPQENPVVGLARGWDRFWFKPADPTLLGFLRIFVGLAVLYTHLAYGTDLHELFGAHAFVDQQAMQDFRTQYPWFAGPSDWNENNPGKPVDIGYYAFSIWYHVSDPGWVKTIHICVLIILLLFTIGFCTRITSVLAWLATVSYIQRAPTSLFGADTMMNLLMLYLMIGPSGSALSVDRLIARFLAAWRALRNHRPIPVMDAPIPRVSAQLALRLIQVNLCFIYLVSGLSKLKGDTWWSGTAIWFTLANPEFSPIHFSPFVAFLRFLCNHIWIWQIVISGGVVFTFFVEIGFPFLVWNRRMRPIMMAAGILMHTGIALSMGLRTFSLFMIAMVISFTPDETVQQFLGWLRGNRARMRLYCNGRDPGQVRRASLIRAFDACDQVEVVEMTGSHRGKHSVETSVGSEAIRTAAAPRSKISAPAWKHLQLVQKDQVVTGYGLFEEMVRALPLLWPLAPITFIPGAAHLGRNCFPGYNPEGGLPNPSASGEKQSVKEESVSK